MLKPMRLTPPLGPPRLSDRCFFWNPCPCSIFHGVLFPFKIDCKARRVASRRRRDVSHTLVYSTHSLLSSGFGRLGGRLGVRRLREPSRERAIVRQSPANARRSWQRFVRGALHDFGLWLCLLARPNQGRQGRLYLLEPNHLGWWRRQRFTGRSTSASRLSACGCCQSNSNFGGYRSQRFRKDGRYSRDRARTGEARRPSWGAVPNAAHAGGDPVRHGLRAWAFFCGKPSTTSSGLTACL